jgi:single-stranded DNA-binding protein
LVRNFSVAERVNKDTTRWWQCAVWDSNKGLFNFAANLKKGSHVDVTGQVNVRAFINKNKEAQASADVTVLSMSYLPSGRKQQDDDGEQQQQQPAAPDEDIPF